MTTNNAKPLTKEELAEIREGANPVPELGDDYATVIDRLLATLKVERLREALAGADCTNLECHGEVTSPTCGVHGVLHRAARKPKG
jgi:hypothetical protein